MSLKIASWNIEGRLTNNDVSVRSTPDKIVDAIKNLDADIIILPEAHNNLDFKDLDMYERIKSLGYQINGTPYNDSTPIRTGAFYTHLSIVLLSRLPVERFQVIRLANQRNLILATVIKSNKKLRVVGLHLDDRNEDFRIKQMEDLIPIINSENIPTVILGDFNAMHGEDLWPAKFLRSPIIRFLSNLILKKLSSRATEMAIGTTLNLLETKTSLIDADPKHQPTTTPRIRGYNYLPSIRLMQIDHIFISPDIKVSNFQISKDNGADHRAISATIDI